MGLITRIADKAGALGCVVSAEGAHHLSCSPHQLGCGHRAGLFTRMRRVVHLQVAAAVRSRGFADEFTELAESSV